MRVAAILIAAAVLAPVALTKSPVTATLTKPLPAYAPHGARVVVAFTLSRTVAGPVYVKVICPTRDAFTRTLAYAHADGRYRVTAIVPPGGLGTVEIGMGNVQFHVTNPGRH